MRPTELEILKHYKNGVGKNCLVCDEELKGYWTDYNGQIKCRTCGMTYQILGCHLKDEYLKKNNITSDDIAERYCDNFDLLPIYRDYYQENKKILPIGFYMGKPPWSEEDDEHFYKWLAQNADKYRVEYKDYFYWDTIIKLFGSKNED